MAKHKMAVTIVKNEPETTVDKDLMPAEPTPRVNGMSPLKNVESKNMASLLANSDLCFKSWRIPRSERFFPTRPQWRTVDRYYPNAECGPLLVDLVVNKHEADLLISKRETLRNLGMKYVIIEQKMSLDEAKAALEVA